MSEVGLPNKSTKTVEKILVRLDMRIPEERDIYKQFMSIPRTRRQEMTRAALKNGYKSLDSKIGAITEGGGNEK